MFRIVGERERERMNPRLQGDLGELSAMEWLVEQGYRVWLPVGHSPDIDVVGTRGDEVVRVQVKTCTVQQGGRWAVTLCTRGGNRSWSGLVKRFAPSSCDRLFVLTADGRRWWIPGDAVGGGTGILLGGPKYDPYEIEGGRPLSVSRAA